METSNTLSSNGQDDHPEQSRSSKDAGYLHRLCEIITDSPLTFDQQINRLFQEGLEMLQLDLGIISNISGNDYTVLHFYPPGSALEVNQVFEVNTTYCALTIQNDDVVAIDHMKKSPYSGHPCYTTFRLEAYIGVPISVGGKRYGTLNFSSVHPRTKPFSDIDIDFVHLMGRWVGMSLSQKKKTDEVQRYQAQLEQEVERRTSELQEVNERLRVEIDEKKLSHQSLWKQKIFVDTLLETISIPVFYKDVNGIYLGCNAAFEKFCGKPKEEIIGRTVFDMGSAEIAEKYYQKDLELYSSPGTQRYEWKIMRSDGDLRDVVFEKATFMDDKGNLAGIVGSIFDITDRKKMEQHLQQIHKTEALGTLAGGIAHDFNNILSVILGSSELAMLEAPQESKVFHHLRQVRASGRRASELVRQILTFSRNQEMNRKPLAIGPILNETITMLRSTIPTTIRIDHKLDEQVGMVLADTTQVHQIIMNLSTNAAQAMGESGGVLFLGLEEVELFPNNVQGLSPGRYIHLWVTDTGIGMDDELQKRIFDPYFTTKAKDEGTGLGLAVVLGIVKGYGGTITVDSSPGQGSRFDICLPRSDKAISESQHREVLAVLPRGKERILLVDDEISVGEVMRLRLESLGYEIHFETDSLKALQLFRNSSKHFDIVVSDLTMPNMTGAALAKEIRKINPEIPIVVCTGFNRNLDESASRVLGIQSLLQKPVGKRELAETVRRVLDSR